MPKQIVYAEFLKSPKTACLDFGISYIHLGIPSDHPETLILGCGHHTFKRVSVCQTGETLDFRDTPFWTDFGSPKPLKKHVKSGLWSFDTGFWIGVLDSIG